MPAYVISYDLRKARNYDGLLKLLRSWNCVSPLESLWVGNLKGDCGAIRDLVQQQIDADDGLLVIELKSPGDWAFHKPNNEALSRAWLKANIHQ
ncbi:hypothetical protein FGU64_07930 [Mesorhizobium sp. 8]|nr:hypothetical protein FGU64_07930 [Mesorhizobium sp. 8]